MTPPKHVLDPRHVTLVFEGPLGFGSLEEKIPTFREEGTAFLNSRIPATL